MFASPRTDNVARHVPAAEAAPKGPARTLVLLGGVPGSGKTTIAQALARSMGLTVVRSDHVRRTIAGSGMLGGGAEWLADRFSPAATEMTYRELLRRAVAALSSSAAVVVEATWATQHLRELADRTAQAADASLVSLLCSAPARVTELRVAERIAAGPAISEATVTLLRRIASAFEPWPQAVIVDTAQPLARSVAAARVAITRALATPLSSPTI